MKALNNKKLIFFNYLDIFWLSMTLEENQVLINHARVLNQYMKTLLIRFYVLLIELWRNKGRKIQFSSIILN